MTDEMDEYSMSTDIEKRRGGCCSDPLSAPYRYSMLIFVCFLSFGSYYCYDNPAALNTIFTTDLGMNAVDFMNLYAWYSWPDIIMSFIGGILIDRVLGVRWGAIVFAAFVFIGQILFAGGAFAGSYGLMYFARFIFGLGGENLAVAQNCYVTVWYKPHEMNFIFGLTLSMARIGSTVNLNTMVPIYNAAGRAFGVKHWTQMGAALMIASAFCILSLICAWLLGIFYVR